MPLVPSLPAHAARARLLPPVVLARTATVARVVVLAAVALLAGRALLVARRPPVVLAHAHALVARRRHEAVDLGRLLPAQVEARGLAVVAERPRARVCPLRLVGVDVDARARLLVVPAPRELLVADAVALHRLAHRGALGHLGAAVRARAVRVERRILAGARHAELHLAAARPLLLLAVDQVAHDALLALALVLGVGGEARRRLRRRLARALGELVLPLHVAPRGARGARLAHAQRHLEHVAREERVLRAVARALRVVVRRVARGRLLLLRDEPAPVVALPHRVAVVGVEGRVRGAAAPAGARVELLVALGVPGLERRVDPHVVGHDRRLSCVVCRCLACRSGCLYM